MKIVFSEECLEYGTPWHPESPDRVRFAAEYLRSDNARRRFEFLEPLPAGDEDIFLVHSEEHVRRLKSLEFYDGDSPGYPNIYKYASLSAGAAVLAARESAFSLTRPPGHHAARSRVAGFCYLNNIAIAVRRLGKKTLIIDIDGHHGDGTQSIFFGDPDVTYVSLHRSPLYPGSGLESIKNCHNYPLPALCGDDVYFETLDRALQSVNLDGITQVAVSAGFDAYESDPLASLGLTASAFGTIGQRISLLGLPVFAVLEGGYDAVNLGPNIEEFIMGLGRLEGSREVQGP